MDLIFFAYMEWNGSTVINLKAKYSFFQTLKVTDVITWDSLGVDSGEITDEMLECNSKYHIK